MESIIKSIYFTFFDSNDNQLVNLLGDAKQSLIFNQGITDIFFMMIVISSIAYALFYFVIDRAGWNTKKHLWWVLIAVVVVNFIFPIFLIPQMVNPEILIKVKDSDYLSIMIANSIISFLYFGILTSIPILRKPSINCRHTMLF